MISCIVNFKDNFTRAAPRRILPGADEVPLSVRPLEHAVLGGYPGGLVSKICEGYEFAILFEGALCSTGELAGRLSALGYRFCEGGDAELALNAYIHYGEGCAARLSGCFAFVVYDAMRRQIFAATDGLAARPLFYREEGDTLICSALSGLLSDGERPVIGTTGLRTLISGEGAPGDALDGIYMLPAAHTLKITSCGAVIAPYTPLAPPAVTDDGDILRALTRGHSPRERAAVIMTGGAADDLLCAALSAESAEGCLHTLSLSAEPKFGSGRRFGHTRVPVSESALCGAILKSVRRCGVPVLSEVDYLLPLLLAELPDNTERVYCAVPRPGAQGDYRSFMLKNSFFHAAVRDTLALDTPCGGSGFFNYSAALAEGIDLRTPFLMQKIAPPGDEERAFLRLSEELELAPAPHTGCEAALRCALRHILLEILSDSGAPIGAFFDKSALLRLCEGNLDCTGISENALLAYLIKLNYWFSELRPRIV